MATLNVFELTNEELNKSKKTVKNESVRKSKKSNRKTVKESVRKFRKSTKAIPVSQIKLESLRFVEEAEENGEIVDYTPEEDVVLVIDPEMEETPATEEEAEEAAEELVGDFVCKCAICGANYICDCDEVTTEDLESEEAECPICGETGEQIIIGEITPTEDAVDVEDEDDDVEEVEVVDDADIADEFDVEDEFDADEDEADEFIGAEEEEDEDEDDFDESISRAKHRTALRRESNARRRNVKNMRKESKCMVSKTNRPVKRVTESKSINLDEVTLNRMLTKFAKENYDNVRFVKITNGKCRSNKLTLEGVVVTKKGSKRRIAFVCENFRNGSVINAKFTENGVFTENAGKKPSFIVDFKNRNNVLTPVSLKYSYQVTENREKFLVSGKVMNESFKRTK